MGELSATGAHELSTRQAFWHCMSLVLGLGTLTVPFTLHRLGWAFGLLTLGGLAWLSSHTSKLLCRCVDAVHHDGVERVQTYSDLGQAAFGMLGRRAVDVVLYVDLVASSALFLVFIATNMKSLLPQYENVTVERWIVLSAMTLLPTVFMKLDGMSVLSALGSYVMVAMVLSVVLSLFVSAPSELPLLSDYTVARFEIQAIGNQVFAFAMHGTLLTIYQDMRRPQDAERMFDRVYLTGFLLKFIVGASGYFLLGPMVSDQITLDLPHPAVRVVITLLVTLKKWLTYALPLEPVARALEDVPLKISRQIARSGLVILTVLVALWLPEFGLMQSLIGSLCAGCLVLVFPVAFYLKLVTAKEKSPDPIELLKYQVLFVAGLILVVFAVIASIREALGWDESTQAVRHH